MSLSLIFLGTSACIPERGGDSPSFIVNGRYLFDLGWHALDNLAAAGVKPCEIKTVFLTHLHHDHYMALPQLIFNIVMTGCFPLSELKIIGPSEDVGRIVKKSADFLELDRFFPGAGYPEVIGLSGGDGYSDGEIEVKAEKSVHPVAGLWYRIEDKTDGKVLAVTGDTAPDIRQIKFFDGADAIISETALAQSKPGANNYGHSSVYDAVKVADEAKIPRMFCIHLSPVRLRETVAEAKKLRAEGFTAEYPEYGRVYEI